MSNKNLQHMINFEKNNKSKIFRKLSDFHIFTENNTPHVIRGLVLCHGHQHGLDLFSNYPEVTNWYMIDIRKETYPDYVCDGGSKHDMSYFPNKYFDRIIDAFCPMVKNKSTLQYGNILDNVRRILKDNGYYYSTTLPHLFFWFLSKDQLNKIKNKIEKMLEYEIKDDSNLFDLLVGNVAVGIANNKKFYEYIDELQNKYSKIIVKKHKFSVAMKQYIKGTYGVSPSLILKKNM